MKRNLITLFLSLAVLFTLLTGIHIVKNTSDNNIAPAPAQNEVTMLYSHDRGEIQSISVKVNAPVKDSYTLLSDITQLEGRYYVNNTMGQPFVVQGDEGFRMAKNSWQMFMLCATSLPTTGVIAAPDMDYCNLNRPNAVIEMTYTNGKTAKLLLGNKTSDGLSCYVEYIAPDDENSGGVYLVPYDFYDCIAQSLKSHHYLPSKADEKPETTLQAAIVKGDGTRVMISSTKGEENQLFQYMITSPVNHGAVASKVYEFVQLITNTLPTGYEATVSTMEELSLYGLDNPFRVLCAFGDGTITDLQIGTRAGNSYYARFDKTGDIYLIDALQADNIMEWDYYSFADRFITLISAGDVDMVEISGNGEIQSLSPVRDNEGNIISYIKNGSEIDYKQGSSFYAEIAGIMFDDVIPASLTAPEGQSPCYEVHYHMREKSGRNDVVITFYDYDEWYTQCTIDNMTCIVRKSRLDNCFKD